MANRISGNVIIVDSAMGNVPLLDTGYSALNKKVHISAIMLSMAKTDASITLSEANTTNVIVYLNKMSPLVHFANPLVVDNPKVPVMTAGTAFIYLA